MNDQTLDYFISNVKDFHLSELGEHEKEQTSGGEPVTGTALTGCLMLGASLVVGVAVGALVCYGAYKLYQHCTKK